MREAALNKHGHTDGCWVNESVISRGRVLQTRRLENKAFLIDVQLVIFQLSLFSARRPLTTAITASLAHNTITDFL